MIGPGPPVKSIVTLRETWLVNGATVHDTSMSFESGVHVAVQLENLTSEWSNNMETVSPTMGPLRCLRVIRQTAKVFGCLRTSGEAVTVTSMVCVAASTFGATAPLNAATTTPTQTSIATR